MAPTRVTVINWRKSSRSGGLSGSGTECVEIGATPHLIGIRDSKLGESSPQLWLDPCAFGGLLTHLHPNPRR